MMSLLIQKSFKARRLRPTNSLCVRVHASQKQIDAEIGNENGYESKDAEQVKKRGLRIGFSSFPCKAKEYTRKVTRAQVSFGSHDQ